jgi:thiamine pyrophosphate-dependent acetolactate synthase large subunit-like protein
MNGAAVIAEILRREGTEFLSCYPRNPLIEACAALDIRPILCRQERVGVGMADGYTRIKRGKRNGVFAAQAGPGIENAFPGIAQAFSENVPLLIRSSFRPGCRWRGNTCGRYSVPPTCIGRSPNGARWRIRSRSCPI